MNRIVEKYGPKGVQVVGIQTMRRPMIREENIVYVCESLKPRFPVMESAWICETPVEYLPWAAVFDHEGNRIFAHNLPGMEEAIASAVAAAPDFILGGPYGKLGGLAAEIAKDRSLLGPRMPDIRRLAAEENGDRDERAEAVAMLSHVERFGRGRIEKARSVLPDMVGAIRILDELVEMFAADKIGEQAGRVTEEIKTDPRFPEEVEAAAELERARTAFRKVPPAGYYTYNLDYHPVVDKTVLAFRARKIIEFRLALKKVAARHADTYGASLARELLEKHVMPEIAESEAAGRLELARSLVRDHGTPSALYDGYLLLHEIEEGCGSIPGIRDQCRKKIESLEKEKADDLEKSRTTYQELNGRASILKDLVEGSGSVLEREKAVAIIDRLKATAREAGKASIMARTLDAFITDLEESLNGPAVLGVALEDPDSGVGAELDRVYMGGSAWKYGLKTYDVIVAFNGKAINDQSALRAALAGSRPGDEVKVAVKRGGSGKPEIVEIVLGRRIQRRGY